MRTILILAMAFLCAMPLEASAGKRAFKHRCAQDLQTYCSSAERGPDKMACLAQHRSQLSRACKGVIMQMACKHKGARGVKARFSCSSF